MDVKITGFQNQYVQDFIALNREWIETYFTIEPADVAQLENAHQTILEPGGEIFFVLEDDRVVGTCAMVPHGPACYELAKMAVSPDVRGRGYGDLLMDTAIKWAQQNQARRVFLLSNTILAPAISLYKKHGFSIVNLGPHPDYARCNIEMARDL